jgi:Flp pilus assembly protein TadG
MAPRKFARRSRQCGTAAVEFALVAVMFFTLILGILELARIMYMYNVLAEVTRRAASAATNIDFRKTNDLENAMRRAVLNESSGALPFGDPITYRNIRIDYLYLDQASAQLKVIPSVSSSCPAQNHQNCLAKSNDISCIRAVRAQVCADPTAGVCEGVQYQMLFNVLNLGVQLPTSSTIVTAETLGYSPGDPLCP